MDCRLITPGDMYVCKNRTNVGCVPPSIVCTENDILLVCDYRECDSDDGFSSEGRASVIVKGTVIVSNLQYNISQENIELIAP